MKATCLYCGENFKTYPYKIKKGKGKYCSTKCYSLSKSIKVKCQNCGKEFYVPKSRYKGGRGKFCSKKCQYTYLPRQKLISCECCGKTFLAKMSELKRNKHHYCSQECAGKNYKKFYSGGNASNWKGGTQRERHNGDFNYTIWRKAVYERDSYTCQSCDVRGGKLNAHHIFSWANYPDLRYEIWNGITLCETCHKEQHKTKKGVLWAALKEVADRVQIPG